MTNRNSLKCTIRINPFSSLLEYDSIIINGQILKYINDPWTVLYLSCTKHISIEIIFISICYHGYLDKVKMIVENYHIDIHAYDEIAFRFSCQKGYLEIAKLMVKLGSDVGEDINIHAYGEWSFRYACRNGHIEIVKWLVELGRDRGKYINIHADNELSFRYACHYGHLDVAIFLVQLCPEMYSYEISNNGEINPIIRK